MTLIRHSGQHGGPEHRRTEQEWRQEISQVCKLMWQKDLVAATDGNVSARLGPDRFLVTPSGFSKAFIEPEHLLMIGWDAEPVGPRFGVGRSLRVSSEILLHLEAYRRRPDIAAVVHAHPPTAVALSIAGVSLARCVLPEVVMGLGLIPTTAYATPASIEGAQVIAGLIESYDALILQRHGSVTVGKTALDAYFKLEKLEHAAIITRTILQLGGETPLPPAETAKLVEWRAASGLLRGSQADDLCDVCGVCHVRPPNS
ncbi:MAG: class II aldolase/adducin family protein [Caldilineales bacterium]|nr:class II aldolase/adducin family protein [Caldilineales bacterium]